MPEFLELLPPEQALSLFLSQLPAVPLPVEEVETQTALGRVAAQDILAPHPLPTFPRGTMDGYAVRARDTYGASEGLPAYLSLIGEVPMGSAPPFALSAYQAAPIHTGGMLPQGADAVVMLEDVQLTREGEIEVLRAAAVGENTLRVGEDVREGQVVVRRGKLLRPADIGGLTGLGILRVPVAQRPHVGLISSGDELVPPERAPDLGQVRDINAYSLSALVEQSGGRATRYGIATDNWDDLKRLASAALQQCDVVVITAGSSASTRDLTSGVIQELGSPGVLVHGVDVHPGKPTILAVSNGKAVIGLPGNPVSAMVIARLFLVPLIHRLLGLPERGFSPAIPATLTVNLASRAGREDWIPVRLKEGEGELLAEPIFSKSNLIFSLAEADGLVKIPADATGLHTNEKVLVELL
jgi:molybdopterin molybdotransferase